MTDGLCGWWLSCCLVSLVVVEDLLRRTSAHVVAVVAPAPVVGDEPGVRLGLELADGGEVPSVEGRAPALLEHGALEALTDRIVVGRAGRDAVMPDPLGGQGVDEGAGDVFGPVVGQDRPDPHSVAPIKAQRLLNESGRHFAGGRAEHDGDDGEAGEDVDGGELVTLPTPLSLPM